MSSPAQTVRAAVRGVLLGLAASWLAACTGPESGTATGAARPAVCVVPSGQGAVWPAPQPAQLFPGLDGYHRPASIASGEARAYFDQGLLLTWGFNFPEAVRSFQRAAELDPGAALAPWGAALAAGPNINAPMMTEAQSRVAFDASRAALALVEAPGSRATPVERALVRAQQVRYAWPPPEDRAELELAYAGAMREVHREHPDDPDVGALFAESLLDLTPWDYWLPDGTARDNALEAIDVLHGVLAIDPDHPLALHLWIHAIEASPHPERALPQADRLRDRVPGAGHLVHMPAHIDIRVGHYAQAAEANRRAIASDLAWVARSGRGSDYDGYRAHNYHFLVYASMFEGRSAEARDAADEMLRELPEDLVREQAVWAEGFLAAPLHVMVRFGRWEEILAVPEPPEWQVATRAVRHYARGLALASLGRVPEAQAERSAFADAFEQVPPDNLNGNNPMRTVLEVGRAMLDGEVLYRAGDVEGGLARLRDAVALDDALRYDEPWGWMQPARHALGALLLEQGRVEEAEQVYLADLERHRENGWALLGLVECCRRQGRGAEADAVQARLDAAWARADVRPAASCYCRRGA